MYKAITMLGCANTFNDDYGEEIERKREDKRKRKK
jgi:hypothetical protein